ncbi:MAG: hypothetical protein A2X64_07115 [Ignavibacteria bacterium GWF2_33_9]|nr:MAG: hypothetical protein A2X64_07115 [Ignavibacteria bacterium GWF2_33_9]
MKKIIFVSVLIVISAYFSTYSQLKKGDIIDRIVAIVGDEAITESDIKGRIVFMMQQNPNLKLDDPVIFKNILNTAIDEKLIIAKAKEDSIEVSDDEVEQRWKLFLDQSIMQLGSEQRVEAVYGMSIPKMKNEFMDEIRNKILSQKIMDQEFSRLDVSNKEVEEFYNKFVDSLPEVPESYSLYRIVKNVNMKSKAKEEIYNQSMKVRDSILKFNTFDEMAAKYSNDNATAGDGGDLGWIQKGKFLPELEKVGFNMVVGEVSLPTETPLGYHIMKLLDKRKEEIKIAHILFKFGQNDNDKERIKSILDSLKENINSLDIFKQAAKEVSDDNDTRGFGGAIGNTPLENLSYQVAEAVKNMKDGEISAPITFSSEVNDFSYQIIYREKVIPKHKANLQDDYNLIKQNAIQHRKVEKYAEWIRELRATMYWEVIKN